MKIENEEALDDLTICHRCHTLHKMVPIHDGAKACCSVCGSMMYRYDSRLIQHGLAWSLTALIFFFIANFFPIVQIEVLGSEQFVTIPKTLLSLFEHQFYLVGIFCTFLIFLFPLAIFLLYTLIFLLLLLRSKKILVKELLVLLSYMKPWSMMDIFLVSILVSLVKLIGYAQIDMGISFWALILFVLVDVYLNKTMHLSEIWLLHKECFKESKGD